MREFEFPSTILMHDIWSTNCDPLTQRLCLRTVWSVRMVRKRQNHAPPGAASCSQQKSNKASFFMDSICSPDRTSKWEPPKRMQKIGNDFKISKLSPQSYCWKLENLYFSTTSVPSRSNRSGVAFIATGTKASSIGNPYSNLPFSSSLCTFLSLRLVCFMTNTHTHSHTHVQTGIDFKQKLINLDGVPIKLQIWDTAGQERFRTLTTAYYRGAMGILLMYDVTSLESFNNLSYWLRNIQEVSGGCGEMHLNRTLTLQHLWSYIWLLYPFKFVLKSEFNVISH